MSHHASCGANAEFALSDPLLEKAHERVVVVVKVVLDQKSVFVMTQKIRMFLLILIVEEF